MICGGSIAAATEPWTRPLLHWKNTAGKYKLRSIIVNHFYALIMRNFKRRAERKRARKITPRGTNPRRFAKVARKCSMGKSKYARIRARVIFNGPPEREQAKVEWCIENIEIERIRGKSRRYLNLAGFKNLKHKEGQRVSPRLYFLFSNRYHPFYKVPIWHIPISDELLCSLFNAFRRCIYSFEEKSKMDDNNG